MKLRRLALLLACLPLLGCAMGEHIVKVRTVKIAIAPEYSLYLMSTKYDPLWRYLSDATGYRMEPVLAMNYRSFLSTVEGSKAELSFQNALLFNRLQKTKKAAAIAASLGKDGLLSGRGLIVVRRDSNIRNVADLKGKTVMIPAREAVLGYVAQAMLLLKNGLQVEKDMSIVLGARHDQVLNDVRLGRVDAGFVKSAAWSEPEGGVDVSDLQILARTDPFPNWCLAAFPESDPVVVQKITTALLELDWNNQKQREILASAGVKGFVDPKGLGLAPIQTAVVALGLPY